MAYTFKKDRDANHRRWYQRIKSDPVLWAIYQDRKRLAYIQMKKRKKYGVKRNSKKKYVPDRFKARARQILCEAIQKGKIVRPKKCSECGGSRSKLHGHHTDYSKPLNVVWLCSLCHGFIHRKLGKGER